VPTPTLLPNAYRYATPHSGNDASPSVFLAAQLFDSCTLITPPNILETLPAAFPQLCSSLGLPSFHRWSAHITQASNVSEPPEMKTPWFLRHVLRTDLRADTSTEPCANKHPQIIASSSVPSSLLGSQFSTRRTERYRLPPCSGVLLIYRESNPRYKLQMLANDPHLATRR
jgi:hypothetical protein